MAPTTIGLIVGVVIYGTAAVLAYRAGRAVVRRWKGGR